MQAAYWAGRRLNRASDGVAAHLYAEFDGKSIEAARLQKAIGRLCRLHPMLRLKVDPDGLQAIDGAAGALAVEVEDLRHLQGTALDERLQAKRQDWSHRKLDIEVGEAAAFGLSLLPDDACRLHVDTDMIAVDPASFRIVMEDLARFYEDPTSSEEEAGPSFFDWLDRTEADEELKRRRIEDKLWWRDRLLEIPPAPALPAPADARAAEPSSDRLAAWLTPTERGALNAIARRHRMTVSTLMLGLFAAALGRATKSERFRLNVPMFWRRPGTERVVGEFSNVLILDVDLASQATLAGLCTQIGERTTDLLSHSAYPGVSVMRDLSRVHGAMQPSPVVFTAGLDLPGGDLLSERVARVFGSMGWAISQGPQVALDAQAASVDGGILINWDIRLDMVREDWIRAFFDAFVSLVRRIAEQPGLVDAPLPELLPGTTGPHRTIAPDGDRMERALTPLQQTYLLGRSEHLPLGGHALQEFREYRGRIDVAALRERLADLVRRHESLRTRIDDRQLVQTVSPETVMNFEEIDLRHMSRAEALGRMEGLREDYAHRLLDLGRSPWQVTAFRLPDGDTDTDTEAVFLLFDALILDGRSIASLAAELFGEEWPQETGAPATEPTANRSADAAYWEKKLRAVEGPPQLPWKRPLDTIRVSRYERQSLTVERKRFKALSRVGAGQHFFTNSTLTSLTLEVLSRWLDEGALCVGIPVAPQSAGSLANRSSFIAVNWDIRRGTFAERARTLQADILEGLEHLAFSGVDINRLLMNANPGGLALPVVVTNCLSWPTLGADKPVRLHGGLTHTPQVAMDIRLANDSDGNFVFAVDYAREAIDREMVADILAALDKAVDAVCKAGTLEISARDVVNLGHYRLNGSETDFSCSGFLQRIAQNLFHGRLEKDALICGSEHISYAALGERVGRIMASLAERGVGKGSVVAICLPRSPEHTATTLACAFLGAIWVPVDAASPGERLRYLMDNCQPDLVVSHSPVEPFETVTLEALLAADAPADPRKLTPPLDALSASEEPAYYLYTSGTTGKPKCVVLANKATSNVIGRTLEEWAVTENDVFISVTPLHHDMSVFDVLGSLTAGATLVLPAAGEEKDAIRWNRLVAEHGVTLWCSVPAILEMLLSCRRAGDLKSLRLIAQGGDYIKLAIIAELRRLAPETRLVSLGGPTETTIWSIWHEIGPDDVELVPYGRPLPANRYFLLNDLGEHCPAGVVGRIHTAGVNVALGYLEDGVLIQSDFVTVEDENGVPVRAFRTGDRGRYRRDGNIVFASRVNGYVKIRGVRVSLPDIENELVEHPAIRRVLAVAHGAEQRGEAAIGGLYVPEPGSNVSVADLRGFARQRLPDSHVPTRFVEVTELPLSANGKPDHRRAREMLTTAIDGKTDAATIPPARENGLAVLDIYLGVLGKPKIAGVNATTDFIKIGLLPSHLKKVSARIREEFGVEFAPQQLARCRNAAQVEALFSSHGR